MCGLDRAWERRQDHGLESDIVDCFTFSCTCVHHIFGFSLVILNASYLWTGDRIIFTL